MTHARSLALISLGALLFSADLCGQTIRGKVAGQSGEPMAGVMVSAFDEEHQKSVSVFTREDGSFKIDGLRDVDHNVRARLLGMNDECADDVATDADALSFTLTPATGEELQDQRPANSALAMLKFDNMKDKVNFKMNCCGCHQAATVGFRTPEKPVDWETMIRRMDGYGGLFEHTQKTIVKRLLDTYSPEAVAKWPQYIPPPPPKGIETQVKITEWALGQKIISVIHDLELGPDGMVYGVDCHRESFQMLDPRSSERTEIKLKIARSPHSIELGNDGNLWTTHNISGEISRFDPRTKEITFASSAEAPAKRGSYPHTLRINPADPEGMIWYTDSGINSVYSMHPKTFFVKEYKLLSADQAVGKGKNEQHGYTPYGLDFSPVDGMIWYSKLSANRIGRIDPSAPDGDIKEWNPPFRGPRRLHVAPDGMVWVPGFGHGVFARFNPKTEEWKVYPLPDADNQIPYALNVDAKGYVWICGTGSDALFRFDPKTEKIHEFRLPTRVTYTREIEFGPNGSIWTCNSNSPSRHIERGVGSIIKLEFVDGE